MVYKEFLRMKERGQQHDLGGQVGRWGIWEEWDDRKVNDQNMYEKIKIIKRKKYFTF